MKKSGPASEEISCSDLKAKAGEAKLNLVYFGAQEGQMFDSYMTAAKTDDKFIFYHAHGDCAADWGASTNSVSVMRTFDASPVHYAGEATHEGITAFMEKNSVPTLIEFTEDFIEPIFGKGKTAVILFTNEKDSSYGQVWAEAASQLKGDILFVVSGTKDGIQSRLAEFIGVTDADTPTIRLLVPGDEMAKYLYPGSIASITIDSIKTFFEDFKAGKLVTHLKSEPIPENTGALTTLVGLNHDSIVMDTTKDVLVKYYAPWCGHCKKLAPIWEELAESVADMPDVVIAKFDATLNEVKGLQIKGYPTLKWFPKDNKNGVDYDEGRELPDFKKFLEKNSSAYKAHSADTPKSEEL